MRRSLIQLVLPGAFALLPVLAAALIVVTLPPIAREFYLEHITPFDLVILILGSSLFLIQTLLAFAAMRWDSNDFVQWPDLWLTRLAQSSEWFPLLGLIGTVAGILQTFSQVTGTTTPDKIIQMYAPAITATGSGLLMALLNILPAWMTLVGRGLILVLAGQPKPSGETKP